MNEVRPFTDYIFICLLCISLVLYYQVMLFCPVSLRPNGWPYCQRYLRYRLDRQIQDCPVHEFIHQKQIHPDPGVVLSLRWFDRFLAMYIPIYPDLSEFHLSLHHLISCSEVENAQ